MTRTLPTAADQLQKEIDASLELVDEIRQRGRREVVPGWVLLRGARACWAVGNLDWARDFYKQAAVALSEYARDTGRRTGTLEQYAQLALGAAWISEDRETMSETGRALDITCDQMLTSTELPPEPLIRVSLLLTRLRIAWFRGQTVLAREHEIELERRLVQLDAWSKAAWQAERSPLSHAAIAAFIAPRGDGGRGSLSASASSRSTAIVQAVQALDRVLYERRAKPATLADLVDEELLSFVAALRDQNFRLPVLHCRTQPGQVAPA